MPLKAWFPAALVISKSCARVTYVSAQLIKLFGYRYRGVTPHWKVYKSVEEEAGERRCRRSILEMHSMARS